MHYSPLLTPELNSATADIPVVRRLKVPGREDLPVDSIHPDQLITREDIQTKSYVLETIDFGDGEELAIVDKAQPHARFDLMLLSSGEKQIPGLANHSDRFLAEVFRQASLFAEYAKQMGLHPVIAWSYDPFTNDRPSGQGEKRFHAHLLARTPQEMETIMHTRQPLASLDLKSRRRIAEESSTIGGLVMHDFIDDQLLESLTANEPFSNHASSVSYQAGIRDGWQGLARARFIDDFRVIDRALHEIDSQIRTSIFDQCHDGASWKRHRTKADYITSLEEALQGLNLSEFSMQSLLFYMRALKPRIIPDIENNLNLYNPDNIVHVYPLSGISYTTCITEIDDKPNIHFRVNAFSDLGGAGTSLVSGIPVKIKKGCGVMTDEEVRNRRSLQRGFLDLVGK